MYLPVPYLNLPEIVVNEIAEKNEKTNGMNESAKYQVNESAKYQVNESAKYQVNESAKYQVNEFETSATTPFIIKASNHKMSSRRHFPQSMDSLGFHSLPSRGKFTSRPNILIHGSSPIDSTSPSSSPVNGHGGRNVSRFPDILPSATEYRDKFRPFTYKNDSTVTLPMIVTSSQNGSAIECDSLSDLVDGRSDSRPNESIKGGNKNGSIKPFRKTEYKSKFKPFDNYAYLPFNGYKKVKNLDQTSAKAAQDWLSMMSESGDVAIENRRKAMVGHSVTGSQSLEAIYRRDSIDGPWFRRDPKYHSLTREAIFRNNNQRH